MAELKIITRDGEERSVLAENGLSVMELIRKAGIDELHALCGGCCSCATCHVYVEGESRDDLLAKGDDEDDLLDTSDHRKVNSRLSCQIFLDQETTGLAIRIAPKD